MFASVLQAASAGLGRHSGAKPPNQSQYPSAPWVARRPAARGGRRQRHWTDAPASTCPRLRPTLGAQCYPSNQKLRPFRALESVEGRVLSRCSSTPYSRVPAKKRPNCGALARVYSRVCALYTIDTAPDLRRNGCETLSVDYLTVFKLYPGPSWRFHAAVPIWFAMLICDAKEHVELPRPVGSIAGRRRLRPHGECGSRRAILRAGGRPSK